MSDTASYRAFQAWLKEQQGSVRAVESNSTVTLNTLNDGGSSHTTQSTLSSAPGNRHTRNRSEFPDSSQDAMSSTSARSSPNASRSSRAPRSSRAGGSSGYTGNKGHSNSPNDIQPPRNTNREFSDSSSSTQSSGYSTLSGDIQSLGSARDARSPYVTSGSNPNPTRDGKRRAAREICLTDPESLQEEERVHPIYNLFPPLPAQTPTDGRMTGTLAGREAVAYRNLEVVNPAGIASRTYRRLFWPEVLYYIECLAYFDSMYDNFRGNRQWQNTRECVTLNFNNFIRATSGWTASEGLQGNLIEIILI